ncbi:hypothetical protein [Bradyrhizobium sp. CCGE-LA001]|uniref:hypothetical protein n=1 Tax=Bradyrhizobium sp. CCGE-LA001 TaxID=1223566 RepID=UPI0002AAAD7E
MKKREAGVSAADLCRKHGVRDESIYKMERQVDGSRTPAALIGPGEGSIFSPYGDRP